MPCCIYNIRNILQGEVKAKNLEFFIDTVDVVDENIICDKVRLSQINTELHQQRRKVHKARRNGGCACYPEGKRTRGICGF